MKANTGKSKNNTKKQPGTEQTPLLPGLQPDKQTNVGTSFSIQINSGTALIIKQLGQEDTTISNNNTKEEPKSLEDKFSEQLAIALAKLTPIQIHNCICSAAHQHPGNLQRLGHGINGVLYHMANIGQKVTK